MTAARTSINTQKHIQHDIMLYFYSGVFRTWQKGGHGERAEREFIRGSPSGVQGQSPWSGGQGRSLREAETFFAFERSMKATNSPIFFL